MANYKIFENTLCITDQMYDFVSILCSRIVASAIVNENKKSNNSEPKRRTGEELYRSVNDDLCSFIGRNKM